MLLKMMQVLKRSLKWNTEDNIKEHTIIELVLKNTYDQELYKLIEEHKEEVDILNNFKEYICN